MAAINKRMFLMLSILHKQRLRKRMYVIAVTILKWRYIQLHICLFFSNFILHNYFKSYGKVNHNKRLIRSCRRIRRNPGWFHHVFNIYNDVQFKKTFRVTKGTFQFILNKVEHRLSKQVVCEEPISPRERLVICLYRLARGDYFYTISRMSGLGGALVCNIVREVCEIMVDVMWEQHVSQHFPCEKDEFKEKILDMEQYWQFPFAYASVDGCHIPIKCPSGGAEAQKDYHNFKNFYSIILIAMVDAKYRFVWASCGYPGNCHDAIILQSTDLYENIIENDFLPELYTAFEIDESHIKVPPLILGDSAFPLHPWLMKPYTNAVLTEKQSNLNYRLSRARMTVEGAYGQLKGRWRVLSRKCESKPLQVKSCTLACIILHNICIERGDTVSHKFDLTKDPLTNEIRPREEIERLLLLTANNGRVRDTSANGLRIRNAMAERLWRESENI